MIKPLLSVGSLLFILFFGAGSIYAHPIDEIGNITVYDQKQTLTIGTEKTILQIDLTFYAFEKMKVWKSINTNSDQILTEEERNTWMHKGSESSFLEISGTKHAFRAERVTIPDYEEFFSTKPVDISLVLVSTARITSDDVVYYYYYGRDKKLEEISFTATGSEGIQLSDLVHHSPNGIHVTVRTSGDAQTHSFEANTSTRLNNFIDTYVKEDNVSIPLIVFALGVSFFIGMLHALTPGHGKAVIAGYLVGERGTAFHAVQLGLIITITHTASVFLLGVATLMFTQYVVPQDIIRWVSMISGFMIVLFGCYLIAVRVRALKTSHDHVHDHDHNHTHHEKTPLTWKNLLLLGISGGLVPCVDALAILIVAVSLGKILLGLIFLVSFSVGLATSLVAGGILVVTAKGHLRKNVKNLEGFEKYSSLISAIIVTILGIFMAVGTVL